MRKQYQQSDCRFCQIASRQIEDYLVWQDSDFSLFLNNKPAKRGHCMLIPNWHVESIWDLDYEQTSSLFNIAKKLSFPLLEYTGVQRMGMLIKGFSISHAHLHLIPLHLEGQNVEELLMPRLSEEELREVQHGLLKKFYSL